MKHITIILLSVFCFGFKVGDVIKTNEKYNKAYPQQSFYGVITSIERESKDNQVVHIKILSGDEIISTDWIEELPWWYGWNLRELNKRIRCGCCCE